MFVNYDLRTMKNEAHDAWMDGDRSSNTGTSIRLLSDGRILSCICTVPEDDSEESSEETYTFYLGQPEWCSSEEAADLLKGEQS